MQGAKRIVFGATAALIGVLIGSTSTYLWFFQDIHHNFPAKEAVVGKIKSDLLKTDADFMHATSNNLQVFPIYFSDRNCVLVRPEKPITFNSNEIFYCFDRGWGGSPRRVVDVTLQMAPNVSDGAAQ